MLLKTKIWPALGVLLIIRVDYILTLDYVHSDSCTKTLEEITVESQITSSIQGLIFDLKIQFK